jgi:hypothetical protein
MIMQLSKRKLSVLVTLLLMGVLFPVNSNSYAASTHLQQGGLFTSTTTQGLLDKSDDPTVVRSRFVNVNFDLLDTRGDLFLNLFDDAPYTAEFERIESVSVGSQSWIGRIAGEEASEVILVHRDGMLTGNINHPGGTYQVRYAGEGVHAIYEIDQTAFPPEAEPIPFELPEDGEPQVESEGMVYDDGSVIDVMVAYTPLARSDVGGTAAMQGMIDLAITESNAGYRNSDVNQQLNLVHTVEVNYSETAPSWPDTLIRLSNTDDGYLDNLHNLRNVYGADHVVLFIKKGVWCGVAYLMMDVSPVFEVAAFSVIDTSCATGYYSFAHELGHNMGSHHDHESTDGTAAYPYSYGYQEPTGTWRTVMSYNCPNGCTRLNYWSNPDIKYGGNPMGVGGTGPTAADNQRSLNNTAYTCANFRQSITLPSAPKLSSPKGTIGTANPTYNWKAVNGALNYRLSVFSVDSGDYVITKNLKASAVCSSGSCSYKPSVQLNQGEYRFKMRAQNAAGWGTVSSWKKFRYGPPVAPTLISPSGTIVTARPTYTWKGVSGAKLYRLSVYSVDTGKFVITKNLKVSAVCSGGTCTYKPATNLVKGEYRFKMRAQNAAGWGPISSWMKFRYGPPDAPTMISPSGTIGTTIPKYKWDETSTATLYRLYVYSVSTSRYVILINVDANPNCSAGTCSYHNQ